MTATVLFACVHNAGRSQMAAAREIRDEIRQRVETLLEHEGWRRPTGA